MEEEDENRGSWADVGMGAQLKGNHGSGTVDYNEFADLWTPKEVEKGVEKGGLSWPVSVHRSGRPACEVHLGVNPRALPAPALPSDWFWQPGVSVRMGDVFDGWDQERALLIILRSRCHGIREKYQVVGQE